MKTIKPIEKFKETTEK